MSRDHESAGITVFVLGLLSIVLCQVLGPIAWLMGTQHLNRCEVEGVRPNQMAVAGRMLGMVGTAFLGLVGLALGLELVIVVLSIVVA